ncbi:hypothetical protein PEP31012_01310 [Pandoraea eparura]|uniref:Uncharacterized protein n=1 Tax=Pandoraea eparura TaxID=2508291 RepID=A0A5E4TF42_9BURK|nr:hypothetical protein [Pandoraea eparura]VVD85148.1 hypothetical protein PEP31012_01310 [Pandoraea eparura]
MNAMSTQAASRACPTRGVAPPRRLALIFALPLALVVSGCAALDPGNWQVVGPPASYVRPAPAVVTPAPVIVTPAPTVIAPAPVIIAPRPPVVIAPAQPYIVVPQPRPRASRDAAHFLSEKCYLEKGGCYTSEYREGYEFNPYTGTWEWVGQRDYRWKGSRGNR